MGKIKQMSEALANQIAAGEVVERPASVVKELVENAIDAGSNDITIELVEAGIQRIRVIDNGEGMDAEDLSLAFLPHATSKIYQLSDLFQIHSLGFRGEALASIGSVAKVRVDSAQAGAKSGNFIVVEGSRILEQGASNARKGTTITVDSLFYNTPARLKHLSSLRTELKHILNFVQDIALSYPAIRFTLMSDGQKIFTAYGNGQLRQTIANVYQPAIARQLVPIEASDHDFHISGFISPPQLTRTSKYYLHWIINGRAVRSYVLNEILLKAYGRRLMVGRYPLAVIRIDLDPRLVDVNVHPTKQTVRLSKESELATLLTEAVEIALQTTNPVPTVDAKDILPSPKMFNRSVSTSATVEQTTLDLTSSTTETKRPNLTIDGLHPDSASEKFYQKPTMPMNEADVEDCVAEGTRMLEVSHHKEEVVPPQALSGAGHLQETLSTEEVDAEPLRQTESQASAIDFASLRYVGQIHGTYLIAESPKGFYLIDQHAAQERLRYEQLMRYEPDVSRQQQLLLPIIFNFTLAEMEEVARILPRLAELGIHLETFGPTSYQLESYPIWIEQNEVEHLVKDLTELLVSKPNLSIADIKEASIIMQSCRGAIKANHYLDDKQAIALIQSMNGLEDPYHCPHGRPVFIEFNQKTLEKLFKRIQDPHEKGTLR